METILLTSSQSLLNLDRYSNTNLQVVYDSEVRYIPKVRKGAKTRNRYNQLSHLTKDTNGKVTKTQPNITNKSQEVSPFPAGDHKA